MKPIFFAFIACFSLLSAKTITQPKDQQAVEQAVEQLRLLMIAPDKDKLDALTADQLSYGHSAGKVEDKNAFVEALTKGTSDFVSITLSEQTISIVDETAVVRHKLQGETLDNGKPGQVKLAVLQIWVKQKGNWKLLARQAVKV